MTDCKHHRIIAWNDMETGDPVGLWSCAACSLKFYPAPPLQHERIKALEEAAKGCLGLIEAIAEGREWGAIEEYADDLRSALAALEQK